MKVRKIAKGQFRVTVYIKISQTQDDGAAHPVMGSAHNTHTHALTRSTGRRTGLMLALQKGQKRGCKCQCSCKDNLSSDCCHGHHQTRSLWLCPVWQRHQHKINEIEEQSISITAENRSRAVEIKHKRREGHFHSFLFNKELHIISKCSIHWLKNVPAKRLHSFSDGQANWNSSRRTSAEWS